MITMQFSTTKDSRLGNQNCTKVSQEKEQPVHNIILLINNTIFAVQILKPKLATSFLGDDSLIYFKNVFMYADQILKMSTN